MEMKLYNKEGSEIGTVTLSDELFGAEPNQNIVHQYVVNYLSNQRQGTASAKGRSDVRGGGKKPYRQKGTGRARAGTIRSPLWRGGGVAFGPSPKSYFSKFPKRMKRLAQISAFSDKARNDNIRVIDDLNLEEVKTRALVKILDNLGLEDKRCLILDEGQSQNLILSVRNLNRAKYARAALANTYDILNADVLLFTKAGLDKAEEVFGK